MKKLLYCFAAVLSLAVNCYSQSSPNPIHPLTIGDTIPANLELTNVYNYPVSKIRLSDLKGKLIILDFWGKYCSSCIHTLYKLDSLQQSFSDKVTVITVSDFKDNKELKKILSRFRQTQNLKLPVILGNEQLIKYFPHTLVSHLIWISYDGVIKAITGGEYVTSSNIQDILDDKTINWPLKKDVIDFDYKRPLLDYVQSTEGGPQYFYYSSLTTNMEGISAPLGTYIDSSRSVTIILFYNQSLLNLIQIALDYSGGVKRDKFILNVKDTNKYIREKNHYYAEWAKENTYCYYAQLPIGLSQKEIENFLHEDILRWLNIMGIYAEKKIKYINGKAQTQYIITERKKSSI